MRGICEECFSIKSNDDKRRIELILRIPLFNNFLQICPVCGLLRHSFKSLNLSKVL